MSRKILILGARGFLGSYLVKNAPDGYDIVLSARSHEDIPSEFEFYPIDIVDRENVVSTIKKITPDVIINCVAISLPDYAETHKEETFKVNVTGVQNLLEACEKTGAKLIHLSTDYVFKGDKGNYKESDPVDPVNYYGMTKAEAEKRILSYEGKVDFLICRTAVLYGIPRPYQRPELLMGYLSRLRENKTLKASTQVANPTFVEDLAQALFSLSSFKESEILHTAGAEPMSRYEFALKIAEVFELDKSLIEKVDVIKKVAKRPQNSSLNVEKLSKKYGIKFGTVEENLKKIKNTLRSS